MFSDGQFPDLGQVGLGFLLGEPVDEHLRETNRTGNPELFHGEGPEFFNCRDLALVHLLVSSGRISAHIDRPLTLQERCGPIRAAQYIEQ